MATDIEESDIDDHERPAPPKRQCTRFIKVNETVWEENKNLDAKEGTIQDSENIEYDEAERCTRERLVQWQLCQVAKGFMDNIINKLLENHIMGAPSSYPLDESRFQTIRGNDMEDTAVLTAIYSHGLVRPMELVSQSNGFYSGNFGNSIAATSTDSIRLNNSSDMEEYNDWDLDKIDDNDQQENFLEQAVAEAIKKKGLIAPSNSSKNF